MGLKRFVITVDGHAGSGKTSISKLLAERLGYAYLSSGGLYRAVGYLALKHGVDRSKVVGVLNLISSHKIELCAGNDLVGYIVIDGERVDAGLHTPEVSEATSQIAVFAEVRTALRDAQRQAFVPHSLVAEGRDMGTVVFPDADLKFFITVNEDVRVSRRLQQLSHGKVTSAKELKSLEEKMKIEIRERDVRDSSREVAPTKAADDAHIIDNSTQTLTQVVDFMYHLALSRGLSLERV